MSNHGVWFGLILVFHGNSRQALGLVGVSDVVVLVRWGVSCGFKGEGGEASGTRLDVVHGFKLVWRVCVIAGVLSFYPDM